MYNHGTHYWYHRPSCFNSPLIVACFSCTCVFVFVSYHFISACILTLSLSLSHFIAFVVRQISFNEHSLLSILFSSKSLLPMKNCCYYCYYCCCCCCIGLLVFAHRNDCINATTVTTTTTKISATSLLIRIFYRWIDTHCNRQPTKPANQ